MARYDLGNVVNFSVANAIAKKDHKRNYGGARKKDYTRITEVGQTCKGALDEIAAPNLALFALGTPTENSDGSFSIAGLSNTTFTGLLEIVGDNDAGPQVDWTGRVQFTPAGDFFLIQDKDDFNTIGFEADVLASDDGSFGLWTVRSGETMPNIDNYQIPTGKAYFTPD